MCLDVNDDHSLSSLSDSGQADGQASTCKSKPTYTIELKLRKLKVLMAPIMDFYPRSSL